MSRDDRNSYGFHAGANAQCVHAFAPPVKCFPPTPSVTGHFSTAFETPPLALILCPSAFSNIPLLLFFPTSFQVLSSVSLRLCPYSCLSFSLLCSYSSLAFRYLSPRSRLL